MRTFSVLLLTFLSAPLIAQINFDNYFTDKILRFDFMLAGNSEKTIVYPVGMKEEPFYGGSKTQLTNPFNYGNFRYELFDDSDGRLIYSRGFCTLFQEWQTTAGAKSMERSFYEVATMPFPREKARFVLSIRQRSGVFTKLYETAINPSDYFIRKEKPVSASFTKFYGNGKPETSVDLAFIAEGYKANEMEKFHDDVKKMADYLFSEAPFSEYKERINIWAVEAVFIIITAVQPPVILCHLRYLFMNSDMALQGLLMNTILPKWLMRSITLWMLSPGNLILRLWWISIPNGKK